MARPTLQQEIQSSTTSIARLWNIYTSNLKKRDLLKELVQHPNCSLDLLQEAFKESDLRPYVVKSQLFNTHVRNDPNYAHNVLYHDTVLLYGKPTDIFASLVAMKNLVHYQLRSVMENVNFQGSFDEKAIDLIVDTLIAKIEENRTLSLTTLVHIVDNDNIQVLASNHNNVLKVYQALSNYLMERIEILRNEITEQYNKI